MYLKTIEIVGFKSFADKTRIDLQPGITGIIGPNGCGKSNIMESVRWSIGEMSWKSLRSDSMISIIFAGTARRNAMNLSEVTLTFDNAQSQLPVQYSEVQVSRRIYRSGDSEYYINKTQCRLRDIRELFLDTGIGNTGYAIIDQGGVDFILNSKPEDRRTLFEEAAGVSKYKAKRQEALRKLDRVEIDLGRLQDSVALIKEQIKKLDADARKARLYEKYEVELAAMEAGQVIKDVGELEGRSGEQEKLVAPKKQSLTELHTAVEADEARLAALDLERTQQEKNVLAASQKVSDCKSEIAQLEERRKGDQALAQNLEEQIAASKQESEQEAQREKDLSPELEKAAAALAAAETEWEKARRACDAFSADFDRVESDLKTTEASRRELSEKLLRVTETCQSTTRRLSECETRVNQLEFEAARSGKELEKKLGRVAAMNAVCGQANETLEAQRRAVAEAARAAVAREQALGNARTKLEDLGERLLDRRAAVASQQAKVEALEIQGQRDPYWVGAHAVVNADLPGVLGTVRSLIEVDEAYRAQVEDLLGERLYAVVCSDSAAAKAGVAFLRESGKGRARFLVASTLPEPLPAASLPPGAQPVADRVRYQPDHDKTIRYLLGEAYAAEGSVFGRHWICGGATESETPRLKLSDIGTLREELARMEQERDALAAEKKAHEEGLPGLAQAISAAQSEHQDCMGTLQRLEAEQHQRQASLRNDQEEVGVLEEEVARIREDAAKTRAEMDERGRTLEQGRLDENELRSHDSACAQRLDGLRLDVAGKRVEKSHLEKNLESAEKEKNLYQSQKNRVETDRETLLRSIERRSEQQFDWERRIRELSDASATSVRRIDEVRTSLAGFEKENAALFATLQKMQLEFTDLSRSVHERQGEAESLQAEIHTVEMEINQMRTRRQMLLEQLAEKWKLTYEDALAQYKDQPVDKERMEFLRRRMANLGNINKAAPEEYEELSRKHDGLQSQIDDLLSAKKDLHSAIAKINATTRENFRQTFAEVREHFRKLYGTLFEGGEADLLLTDKDNMLESGIDIVAQPPGKKLQSISQLSGGEKTLTAIALLFAFFMVKPSPMCMLDEADAALDDANVERFVSLIREFGAKTQFLIVSHNKLTMEACDAIYGVTMEESGVSQLISIDFKKRGTGVEDARFAEPDESALSSA